MALFQKSVLNKFIKSQDNTKIEFAYQRFSAIFLPPERQAEIRSMKEEEYQDGFLDDLFVNILGYIKRPNSGFNLVREKKNEADSKKADGAILKNHMPLAVIELKGTETTDLDKVTNQGFGYKNNHKECVYVVISNFEKLRFFIHHAVDYIEFNLFTLSKEDFTTLWLCLYSDNLLENIPAKIKAESVVKEEDITKSLYKDYSAFKQELFQSIINLNSEGDPLIYYKKTQKLIDRFLFIFFAEDAGLLPPNSISSMVERWKMLKDEDAYKPLYQIFKQYFGYINTGRPGKTPQDEIFAYNGGLMLEDDVLESITISDEVLLKHVSRLTTYDFSSEIDVNILGHIFENSLNDIEAVTAELEGKEIDKSKTKRKKDGVFYTPKYITKYIVDNTVGKLCDEKKVALSIIDEDYAKGRTNRKKETLKQLDENLQAYRNWLLNITICDPACGSGAFLNQALEYLMEEHRYIDELESQLLGAGFTFPGVENHILENNIFGVDINDESIEIAKLSLWLRTAQRGRKLTSLNNNIKCGNSLIDDPEVAGDKAFNWQKEFPTVFKEKNKFAYHITTCIHDSRTSERMIKYKARERRFEGTKPDPEVFPMTKEEEELIAATVADIVREDKLNIATFNLCWDHMHILLVCEEEEVSKIVQKIKAKTARAVNIFRGKTKVVEDYNKGAGSLGLARGEKQNSLWTQKYHCKPITSDDQFWNTHNYIEKNKVKHDLPKNPKLEKIILGFVKTYEDCLKTEYNGGFDVVIGNPPYVSNRNINAEEKPFFTAKYSSAFDQYDLYVLFMELSQRINKINGYSSFILPDKFLISKYGEAILNFLSNKIKIEEFWDLTNQKVFTDASVYPVIYVFKNVKTYNHTITNDDFKFVQINKLIDDFESIINKIDSMEKCDFDVWRPLSTSNNLIEGSLFCVSNSEVNRYNLNYKEGRFSSTNFRENDIQKDKILIKKICYNIDACIDFEGVLPINTTYCIKSNDRINLRYLLTILNSKLLSFFARKKYINTGLQGGYIELRVFQVKDLPIIKSSLNDQVSFIEKADLMLTLNKDLQEQSKKFLNILQSDFKIEKPSKKIEAFYTLSWSNFEKESLVSDKTF